MDCEDEALEAFKKMNPVQYEQFPNTLSSLIRYLSNRFKPIYRVRQIQSDVENGMLETARERILNEVVEFLGPYDGKHRTNADREMIGLYVYGWLTWFLEYERGIPACGKIFEREKRSWAILRYVFELDRSVAEDDESDEFEETGNAEMDKVQKSDGLASNAGLAPGAGSGRVIPAALDLQSRIKRNITKAQAFDELQFPSTGLPNIGPVNRAKFLDKILSEASQHFPQFSHLFETVDAARIKEDLEQRLNQSVRTICENGLFDIEQ